MSNPYNYHLPVQSDDMFYGRAALLRRLLGGLTQSIPLSAALFGGRRSGKTSLLRKIERDMRAGMPAPGARRLIPWYYDPQAGYPISCADDFFLLVLEELRQVLCADDVPRAMLEDTFGHASRLGPVRAFEESLSLLDEAISERFRLVILIDEAEALLEAPWGADLRPNLRNLLSNSNVASSLALVMSGSTTFHTKVTEKDSPLENILTRYSLTNLSRQETLSLAQEPSKGSLSTEAAEEVWIQTGGHPCLVQFLMHELWYDLPEVSVADVQDVGTTFSDLLNHFERWSDALPALAHDLYRKLIARDEPASYATLRRSFSTADGGDLQRALDALAYHGLIRLEGRGRRTKYGTAGRMYRDWYLSDQPAHTQTPIAPDPVPTKVPASIAYEVFDIETETRSPSRYEIQVLNSPAGSVRSEAIDWTVQPDLQAMLERVEIGDVDKALLTEVGQRLYQFLFADRVREAYAASQRRSLCINLRIHQPELAALPWELLYDPHQARFVALSGSTPLIRALPGVLGPRLTPPSSPRQMLLVTASPDDWPKLAVDKERDMILQAIDPLVRAGQIHVRCIENASAPDLLSALRAGVHWLHFCGHAVHDPASGGGALVLQDTQGRGTQVDVDTLRHLIPETQATPGNELRLVFLNACSTAQIGRAPGTRGLAQVLVQAGVPTTIGMGRPIADTSARAFSAGFYGALADRGGSFAFAVSEGRRRAMVESGIHSGDWAVPVHFQLARPHVKS